MAEKQVIVVLGATGSQGGGVVDALLKESDRFSIRALTRNASSAKAEKLASRGVEVVQGDLSDEGSLVKAFTGAAGVFIVTDFFQGAGENPDTEFQQGKNAIEAAKKAGVAHIVWSGLEDVRKLSGVKEKIPEVSPGHHVAHFEGKGEVTEYLKTAGVAYTALITSMYYDNFLGLFPFVPQGDGTYALYSNAGDVDHSAQDVYDIGGTVAEIFTDPKTYAGKTIPVVGERLSFGKIAETISDVTGKQLKYIDLPDEAAAAAGYPGAHDIANMFAYYRLFPEHYNGLRPLEDRIYKGKSFRQWAEDNKEALTALFK